MKRDFKKLKIIFSATIILAIFFAIFPFLEVKAAISRVQTIASGNNSPTVTATWPAATTAGNLLVAIVAVRGGTARTITPPAGLGWTLARRSDNGTTISTAIYYIQNAASQSGGSTWTLNTSARVTLTLAEYSGAETSSVLDKTAYAYGASTTGTSGATAVTSQADEVAVAAISSNDSRRTYSAQTNGFSEVSEINSGGNANGAATVFEEKILSAAGAQSVSATISSSSTWAGVIATFKAAVSNPVPTTTSISPTSATYGDAQLTLTVNGTNFIVSSVVNFAGSARTTTYVSSTQLTATIPASDLLTVGTYNITVTNPAPGGGTSNAQTFTVNKANQATLTLTGQTVTYPTAFASLSTTGGSGTGTVTYAVTTVGTAGCSIVGLTLSYTSAGTCGVTATKAADTNYNATSSAEATFTVNNPAPTTTSISPTSKTVGALAFTMTVNGTNFISSSVVNFAGSARTTTYVSSTQVTASILASDLLTAGIYNITVTNPSPGGATSNAQLFNVNNPVSTTTSISPTSKSIGASAFTLTVNGTNFVSTSVVNFAGSARTTTFVSATQLTASILVGDLTVAGIYDIVVTNPTPGGGTSNSQTFTVNNPAPTTTSISPSSKILDALAFTMTVSGTNFISGSVVLFDGSSRTTNFVSSTELSVSILASDLLIAGTYPITVENPSPGGGTSNAQTFTVGNPVPTTTSISPMFKNVGDTGFTLTVNGTGFLPDTFVKFDGVAKTTTYVSATQITALILESDLATAGSFLVVAENPSPGGGESNAQIFTVHNLIPSITSISAYSTAVGSAQFVMTVRGFNFELTSEVKFGASSRATTFVSSTELSVVISASDLESAGTFSITVYNPSTSENSNAQSFTVGPLGRHEFNYSKTFYGSGSLKR